MVLHFGLLAALATVLGTGILSLISDLSVLVIYDLRGRENQVTIVKTLIGVLIVGFALLELSSGFAKIAFSPRYLTFGGQLSGFLGGLSGNQCAFHSAFMIKCGPEKDVFVGTGVVVAVVVGSIRLLVYGISFYTSHLVVMRTEISGLVVIATAAAFLGAYFGVRLLKNVTLCFIQLVVAVVMMGVGIVLAAGLI